MSFTSSYPPPVFIRGIMPRSGTVFLGGCLARHPSIAAYPNEVWEFTPCREMASLMAYLKRIPHSRHTDRVCPHDVLPHMGEGWLSYLYTFVNPSQRLLMKYPSVDDLGTFLIMFPTAYILTIVRDGRDVVASGLRSGFVAPPRFRLSKKTSWRRLIQPSDFQLLCRRYAHAARDLLACEQAMGEDTRSRYLRIRFEDLHAETEATVRRILEWAALPTETYDWAALRNMPVKGSSYLRDAAGNIDFQRGREKTGEFNPVGRWHEWSASNRKTFEREAGPAFRELGYV